MLLSQPQGAAGLAHSGGLWGGVFVRVIPRGQRVPQRDLVLSCGRIRSHNTHL